MIVSWYGRDRITATVTEIYNDNKMIIRVRQCLISVFIQHTNEKNYHMDHKLQQFSDTYLKNVLAIR